ncbi:MAG: electron transfer flavoprotein subunit beta/FixA family protein [Planctomycetes bacterium]|jgi:electron transfer flavoprotein beta subunit|nr:electron transfer flavoprotein subunit beta/FixA family protein [Planctomycetota bacterium]MBT6453462.1 electron transfer flavoprotein subunit beta/FixA family protein [Planctomycetota bacterium]MBT6541173.1 electron transfer flavoprotein subunit beta/FixA family protein [Planctomycetota bacterium]MBT6784220.1 electron transfer flavoprotein subunit beta/FixA family protein [Planctomycetota bacterium]MBT6969123.1 electron transfer flavoprotein subunit beta/FixA family protein [Planctomycetota
MKIAVCMKRVPDTATRLTFAPDGQSIDTSEVQWVISPYDEFAIEEALRIRERHGEGSVTVITVGTESSTKELRQALGMGVDDAVLASSEEPLDPIQTARALASILESRADDVVLFGRQAVDSQGAQVGALVARLLDRPFVNDIAAISIEGDQVRIEREVEGGREVIEGPLPIVVGADKSLNDPRYPKLKEIMKAKKKPIEIVTPETGAPALETIALTPPPPRPEGRIVGEGPDAVEELIRVLREEAKVI